MKKRTATALVIAAGVFWGVISLFIHPMSERGYTSREIAFIRMVCCAVILFFFLLCKDRKLLKIKLRDLWIFVGTGIVSLTLFNICYFVTMIDAGASVAVALLYTSPVFIMLFSAVLFREKITKEKIAAIVSTVVGVIFVSGMIGSGTKMALTALLVGIGAGLFYALYSVFGRYGTEKYHPFTVTFYTFVFATIGSLFIADPAVVAGKIVQHPSGLLIGFVSAFLCGVLPYVFYTIGLTALDTTVAGVLVAVEPLVGSVIGIAVFHDDSSPLKILGIILILFSIVILSVPQKKERNRPPKKCDPV